ncbi:dTDP-4-dehydrorhamnose 3,5-epimerase [Lentibacter algarum]|uniref:dTDP-4-dehydrorhamnose 3,5-epimerase n=1 Tax=Lentibacter algarum TaxID=576131 RepID=UPI001C0661EF|nr:dTDP-4-dehydrorhamnose 3,5-epimerase [Lentibacter algarum]MBU2980343.1 dTDP-4-dehydrorhamnose 3,5-epimerase [Lentibacter algarum]
MKVTPTSLPDVLILEPARYGDSRGFFSESWNKARLAEHGIEAEFVQDNHSLSSAANTVRGLHFQAPPLAQAKLVRCGRGSLFDVAVDIRRGSPTYGKWVGVDLSFENGKQLYIPEGYAHGFITREPDTEIIYKCNAYYSPEADGAILWNSCGVDWGFSGSPELSAKDADAMPFDRFESPFVMESST